MISKSLEEYLKAMYILKTQNGNIRVTDIANKMDYSKASVNKALRNLKEYELVNYEAYGTIELTKKGEDLAKKIIEAYDIVYLFLKEVLNLSKEEAEKEAEKIKMVITDETINKLAKYVHKTLGLSNLDCDYDINKERCRSCERRKENKKVLLGMSGGVDSSVSAILLKNQGYEVLGTTLELFNNENNNSIEAKNVCNQLKISHYSYNYEKEFKKHIIDDFIECYANCKTPNPCIECNRYMKFGAMWEKAKELGCNYIATGHYAKTEYSEKYGIWILKKSNSIKKDQSYVLWNIPKEVLEHVLFPLADFENKEEIRKIAEENGLGVANKPDSEDICFIPEGNYKKFLEENSNIKPKKGNIVNSKGEILGKHTGLYNYTIGQRKGLGIAHPTPLFVLGFNKQKNEVIVGEEKELYKKEIMVSNINLLLVDKIEEPIKVQVKTRYSSKEAEAEIIQIKDKIKITFGEPQRALTPGQSAVFYIDDIVVGGGKII